VDDCHVSQVWREASMLASVVARLGGDGKFYGARSISCSTSAMAITPLTQGDLVKNFPTHFSQSDLIQHFTNEYEKLMGSKAE